jgi:glucans biosynthesis protein C
MTTDSPRAAQPSTVSSRPQTSSRLLFIDNIRILLTILVLLHHLMITYSGTGSWFYNEGRQDFITGAVGGWFCAANQSYFMGLFLLISAYFVPGSYDRKGAGRFLKDRLIRLGIPLAVYSWIINPLFVYALRFKELNMPFWQFLVSKYFAGNPWIGAGPLWFVEVLLLFSLIYVLWRWATRSRPAPPPASCPFPSSRAIALLALLLAVGIFLVRIPMPMDSFTFGPLNLQLPFFVPYIALFVIGVLAYRRNWLAGLPDRTGRGWLIAAIVLCLAWIPMMLTNGAAEGEVSFKGGLTWQALVYAFWEAFFGLSACIGVVYVFRRFFNRRGKVAGFLAPNAYTAYIIHAPVITFLAIAVKDLMLYPLLKWGLVALVAVPMCFVLSALIRKIPYTEKVL